MATSQLLTDTKKFDEMIVDVIADLRKNTSMQIAKAPIVKISLKSLK